MGVFSDNYCTCAHAQEIKYIISTNNILMHRFGMEPGEQPLDRTYLQCKTARRLAGAATATDISPEPGSENLPDPSPYIGSLQPEDNYSFRGSRVIHAGQCVNQSICLSFDPSNMHCLACQKEHMILDNTKPMIVGVSDQNFVTSVSGGEQSSCISIVRLEDGDLHDLTTLTFEIFDRKTVVPGSVILLGSASHLARVGSTGYAVDWTKCVQRFKSKWADVLLLPLFPIPLSNCETSLARELKELSVWFEYVYKNTTHGLSPAWSMAVTTITNLSKGSVTLPTYEYYTVSFPKDLAAQSPLTPFRFKTNISRPTSSDACDCKTANEMVRDLILNLNKDLHMGISLEIDHLTSPCLLIDEGTKDTCKELVVIGASHMYKTGFGLNSNGYVVHDVTVPGWVASPHNVEKIRHKIEVENFRPDIPCVMDLFSNSVYRFVDYDGSLSMPQKTQSGYHMNGEVTLCDNQSIVRTLDNLKPLLDHFATNPKIIVPPQPRYLFDGCCNDPEHCAGVGGEEYKELNLANLTRVRNVMKSELLARGVKNFWVLDSFAIVGDVKHADHEVVLNHLALISKDDGVHYTDFGYSTLAAEIGKSMEDLIAGRIGRAATQHPDGSPKIKRFFWKGFYSCHGSNVRPYKYVPSAFGRRGGGRFHPDSRK